MKSFYSKVARIFATLFTFILCFSTVNAQYVFEDWVSKTGTQDFYYYGTSVTDAAKNVYQVGATFNAYGNYDAIITKYNKSGIVLWTKTFDGPTNGDDTFTDVVLNGSTVLITGTSRNAAQTSAEVFTIKLSTASGNTYWSDRHTYAGSLYNVGAAITYDGSGNVYVAGVSYNLTTFSDILAIKYNSAGVMQWDSTEDINGMEDVAAKLVYNNGSITLTGGTQQSAGKWRYMAVSFSANSGAVANTTVGSSSVTSIDQVRDVAIDDSGNIYLTGFAGTTSQGYNMYTMKLDEDLNLVWDHSYNLSGSGDDRAYGIALDNANNVIVTGCSDLGSGNNQFTTIKYSNAGSFQWVKHYDVSTGADTAKAVITDGAGNIFITGSFYNGSNQDVKTIKYNSSGAQQWEIDYNGINNGDEYVMDITHDGEAVIVTTQTNVSSGFVYEAIRYIEKDVTSPPDEEEIPSSKYFTQNAGILRTTSGAMASSVKFIDKTDYPAVYVHNDKLSYVFAKIDTLGNDTVHRIDMVFNKNNKDLRIRALDKIDFYQNYYIPTVAQGKRERVASYQKLISFDTWDNIDLMITHNDMGLKYYLVCKPGFDPNDFAWSYSGANSVTVNGAGELVLSTNIGDMVLPEGEAYEVTAGGVRIDKAWQPSFTANGANVSLTLGAYNSSNTLVLEIDKGVQAAAGGGSGYGNMLWNSYYGGIQTNHFKDVVTDNTNGMYILGEANSEDIPNAPGQTAIIDYQGGYDATVLKLSSDVVPEWLTFYGGSESATGDDGDEIAKAIDLRLNIVDAVVNEVYICGYTNSVDMIIEGTGADATNNCSSGECLDGFVAQFDQFGALEWSTYFGDDGDETLRDIAIDGNGNIYAVGSRNSNTTSTPKSGADNYTDGNGLLLQFNENKSLVWANPWKAEAILSIAIDNSNLIYLTGATSSADMPVQNTDFTVSSTETLSGSETTDAFVCGFNASSELKFSFFLGSDCDEAGNSIKIDDNGNCYVMGHCKSVNFSTSNCVGNIPIINNGNTTLQAGSDDFLLKFKLDINQLVNILYSGYYGGSGGDGKFNPVLNNPTLQVPFEGIRPKLAIGTDGVLFITSYTRSQDDPPTSTGVPLPTQQPSGYYVKDKLTSYNSSLDPAAVGDIYISAFDQNMNLVWTTYYGSDKYDYPGDITVSRTNNRLIVVGTGNQGDDPVSFLPFQPLDYSSSLLDYYQHLPGNLGNKRNGIATMFDITDIDIPLSVEDYKEQEKVLFSLFPNPAQNQIQIRGDEQATNIRVYDAFGKLVYSEQPMSLYLDIDISQFASGVYFVQYESDSVVSCQKFIKQ